MRALIVIAHGSRRRQSNEEVRALAASLQQRLGERYQSVTAAFLELAEPTIAATIDDAVAAGATEVVLLPYFLAAGRHVSEDLPALVAERQQAYPDVPLRLLPHLGANPALPDLLAALL